MFQKENLLGFLGKLAPSVRPFFQVTDLFQNDLSLLIVVPETGLQGELF
jgi:hypothetical protein